MKHSIGTAQPIPIGAILAMLAAPMIFDRGGSTRAALITSMKAVAMRPLAMALWAALIVTLTMFGVATLMAGMIIVLPLIGHAAWRAHKDLVE
jgi:uncharacterized membrane protein